MLRLFPFCAPGKQQGWFSLDARTSVTERKPLCTESPQEMALRVLNPGSAIYWYCVAFRKLLLRASVSLSVDNAVLILLHGDQRVGTVLTAVVGTLLGCQSVCCCCYSPCYSLQWATPPLARPIAFSGFKEQNPDGSETSTAGFRISRPPLALLFLHLLKWAF